MAEHLFTRDCFAAEGDDAGVFISGLGDALTTWVSMQQRAGVTVAEAAVAFNTTPEVIREAADGAPWLFYSPRGDDPQQQILETDGD